MDHPQDSAFESFVIGAMSDEESAAFVAHTSACDACAKKLEVEAQTELAMFEVHAESVRAKPVRLLDVNRRRRALYAGATGALALAAALFLFVRGRTAPDDEPSKTTMTVTVTAPPATQAPKPLVVCPDGLQQEKCVEDAHRHGLFVSYPPWAGPPSLGGGRSGTGPNGSPFTGQQQM